MNAVLLLAGLLSLTVYADEICFKAPKKISLPEAEAAVSYHASRDLQTVIMSSAKGIKYWQKTERGYQLMRDHTLTGEPSFVEPCQTLIVSSQDDGIRYFAQDGKTLVFVDSEWKSVDQSTGGTCDKDSGSASFRVLTGANMNSRKCSFNQNSRELKCETAQTLCPGHDLERATLSPDGNTLLAFERGKFTMFKLHDDGACTNLGIKSDLGLDQGVPIASVEAELDRPRYVAFLRRGERRLGSLKPFAEITQDTLSVFDTKTGVHVGLPISTSDSLSNPSFLDGRRLIAFSSNGTGYIFDLENAFSCVNPHSEVAPLPSKPPATSTN